jgi:predicted DNA-binding transcriptional regulator YafY
MKQGYYAGTGILTAQELKSVYQVLQSQAKSLEDPLSLKMYELLKERISFSKLEQNEIYPVRAIANNLMIDLNYLHESILLHQLEQLEQAIEKGELIELNRSSERGKFSDDTDGFFKVWPLQIVFYNFAWYLGYECADGANSGFFRFERLDRLFRGQPLSEFRTPKQQWHSLNKLQKLLKASAGIFLGNSVEEQNRYLNSNKKSISDVETLVELHFTDNIFRFIAEVTKRFPQNKFKMSPLKSQKKSSVKVQKLYSLSPTQDSQFPHRFQVILPHWSLEDVDFIRWIVGFGGQVKVHQPEVLQKRVYLIGEEIQKLYAVEMNKL